MTMILRHSLIGLLLVLSAVAAVAHDQDTPKSTQNSTNTVLIQAQPGANAWNAGQPPADWWEEIKRQHGHVGPWNVLGWRIGQAALREFKCEWGRHELEVVCYVPLLTPFTCMADGLVVGTGNSIGRLDVRLAETLDYRESFVAVRRKHKTGGVLEFRPNTDYLKAITNQPVEALERLSRECSRMPEEKLFNIRRF